MKRLLTSAGASAGCLLIIWQANLHTTGWVLWVIVIPVAGLYGFVGREFVEQVELHVRRAVRAWRSRRDAA